MLDLLIRNARLPRAEATPDIAIEGDRIADGLAIGRAVKHEPHVPPARLLADDPDAEAARLEAERAATEPKVFTQIHMRFTVTGRGLSPAPHHR